MTLTIDLPDEDVKALAAKALAQGVSAEHYARLVLERDLESNSVRRPISQTIREIWSEMPDDVQAQLPQDGASQVDHYTYGLPKRGQ
jgi:plasmid stability protein